MKTVFRYSFFIGFLIFGLISLVLVSCDNKLPQTINESSLIKKQFKEYLISDLLEDNEVKKLWDNMLSNGNWSDINYTSKRRSHWEPLDHLRRLVEMSKAYANPDSKFYKNSELLKSILGGLNYWLNNDYSNTNWWSWKIGVPENMLYTFLLLGDDLPSEILKKGQDKDLSKTKMGMTGQNKVWLAGIDFMKSFLVKNDKRMTIATDTIWSELKVSTSEGIQPDWSFHQHGPQQQFGNYGQHYTERMIQWASILKNTKYAMPNQKLELLRNYQLEGAAWVLWNGNLDISACGRKLNEGFPKVRSTAMHNQLKAMIGIDPKFKSAYEASFETPNSIIGHKSFWRSEMAVHRTEDWYASVKMSSTRVIGAETCNSENMCGLHLGDGVLLTYIDGYEYEAIAPLWDWRRLPGTTCDQKMNELEPKGWDGGYGESDFSGVIGNKKSGLAAMIYKRNNLVANKSWFFMDDQIVCLGAEISGKTNGEVFTSIEQSLLKGKVESSKGELTKGNHILPAKSWVHHQGIGYQVLENSICDISTVSGNWVETYPTYGNVLAKGNVFSLYINHGNSPKEKSYAYSVYPNAKLEDMSKITALNNTVIISNTVDVQAIEKNQNIWAVFYKTGVFKTSKNIMIKADNPCLLMLTKDELVVGDPLHQNDVLNIWLGERQLVVNLPKGINKGKPVSIKLK